MRVWSVIAVALVLGSGIPVTLHVHVHGAISPVHAALAFFLWLNVIINLWELCLLRHIDAIAAAHPRLCEAYRGRELARVKELMWQEVPLARLFSPALWAGIWSTYALYDESYASRKSFGFFVDVGNGLTTLVPSLIFLYSMTFELVPARALGILGLLLFYQMWYGTLVYLFSYFFNRRHRGRSFSEVALLVLATNGLWLTFPLLGAYVSISMILG